MSKVPVNLDIFNVSEMTSEEELDGVIEALKENGDQPIKITNDDDESVEPN